MKIIESARLMLLLGLLISLLGQAAPATADKGTGADNTPARTKPLLAEIVVSNDGILLDFAGPAEVFREAYGVDFTVYYIAETLKPVRLKGGMTITPDFTFQSAPAPDYVVIGTQGTMPSAAAVHWMQGLHHNDKSILSVCTGSDWLGRAGLLDHKEATTHHNQFQEFQQSFPGVKLVQGKRYVQSDPYLFTAGGFTAGMDLALHILDLRFGRNVAQQTAARLEYQGQAWISNDNAWATGAGK